MRENGGQGSYPNTLKGGAGLLSPHILTPLREGERDTAQSNSHWGGA